MTACGASQNLAVGISTTIEMFPKLMCKLDAKYTERTLR